MKTEELKNLKAISKEESKNICGGNVLPGSKKVPEICPKCKGTRFSGEAEGGKVNQWVCQDCGSVNDVDIDSEE